MPAPTIELSRSEARRVARGVQLLVSHHGGQKAAARTLLVSHGTICTLLQGKVGARLKSVVDAVARALKCSTASLLAPPAGRTSVSREGRDALAGAASQAFGEGPPGAGAFWVAFGLYVATESGAIDERAAGAYVQHLLDQSDQYVEARLWDQLDGTARARWVKAAEAVDEVSFLGVPS